MHHVMRTATRLVCSAFVLAAIALHSGPAGAQAKLSSSQQNELSQCLVGCKKGDAGCQNACMQKSTPPDYAKDAGSCVRTCADALVGPGAKNEQADDMVKCVQACN